MPGQDRGGGWTTCNGWLYRAGHAARRIACAGGLGRRLGRRLGPATGGDRVLYVANGRLGDSLLAAAFTARYQRYFGKPVVALGRPEVAPVLAPHVDRFLPFAPPRLRADPGERDRLIAALSGGFDVVFGDLHLAHGAEDLADLFERIPAGRKFVSPGLGWPASVLPRPSLPPGAERLPGAPAGQHLWQFLQHYHQHLGERLGRQFPVPEALIATTPDAALPDLPTDFVGCQPNSAQPKKDWPWRRWLELFETCTDRTFVLLGLPPHSRQPLPPHVVDRRGRTSLAQALAIAGRATAFVGVDSGLTHAAAIANRPTVCVLPSTLPGLFFPYPANLRRPRLEVVRDPRFADCAGCQGLCRQAPLWRTLRHGWPCLVDLPVASVRAALSRALATPVLTECAAAGRC